jgi:hypothetical protein
MHLTEAQTERLRAVWRMHKWGAGGDVLVNFAAPGSLIIEQLASLLRGLVAELNSIASAYLCEVRLSPSQRPLSVIALRPAPELDSEQRQHLRRDLSELIFVDDASCHVMLIDRDTEKALDTVGLRLHPCLAA